MKGIIAPLLLFALVGCSHHPIRIFTDNKLKISTDNRVHLPPTDQSGLLVPVSADGRPIRCASRIALVDVDGLLLNMNFTGLSSLGENPLALFREKLDAVSSDPAVRAVVLRINSPGGSVTATDAMWRDLQNFRTRTRLPVVACVMDYGTGGAYYLSTASDSIVAHPTSVTGAIGVILNLYNLSETLGLIGKSQDIKAGKNVDMGTTSRNLNADSDDEKARKKMLQIMADEFHERFVQVVLEARPAVDQPPSTFDGRIFTAQQALQLRLIDRIGYLDDAVQMARMMANCETAEVVMYRRPNDITHNRYAITPNSPLQTALLPSIPRSHSAPYILVCLAG